jgi:hypothetical protein
VEQELLELFDVIYWCDYQSSIAVLSRQVVEFCSLVREHILKEYFNNDYNAYQVAYKSYEADFLKLRLAH